MSDEENAALVIKTGIEQMFVPLHQLLDKLLGPAATEVGLTLGDSVKVWRFKRQVRLLEEVKRLIEHSGKDIKPIATRLFFPVLEAASIEDDDDIQTRWAALLANEATRVGSVHPSFIDILRQLAPDDARLLDQIYDKCERNNNRKVRPTGSVVHDWEMGNILKSHEGSLENLVRLALIQADYEMEDRQMGILAGHTFNPPAQLKSWYELADFAVRFVSACRAPSSEAEPGQ
ncbi:MAG: Abi-alpha family protein [Candidatus Sulfotelmatobacter sp.]